jgi:hypothetical protein
LGWCLVIGFLVLAGFLDSCIIIEWI